MPGLPGESQRGGASLSIGLSAVIVAASVQEPRVLTIKLTAGAAPSDPRSVTVEALPSGPLEAEHRTLEIGLRSWVERQTSQSLGYVEQLYTFGDRDRSAGDDALALPALVVAYLALVREARPAGSADAEWRSWYRYFPWEDWRDGRPALLDPIETALARWGATSKRRGRAPPARGAGRAGFRPGVRSIGRGVERGAGARTLRTAVRSGAGVGSNARSRPPGRS